MPNGLPSPSGSAASAGPLQRTDGSPPTAPLLYLWQIDALEQWLRCGRRGVIEAVTGAGKTDVALAAIGDALARDRFVLVVVPSRVLMTQWYNRLTARFGNHRIGRLGDAFRDKAADCDVLVTTRHSASSRRPRPPDGREGLLVADECHGFGGDVLRKALIPDYRERMGLTATLERSDDGVDTRLLPYFGGLCFRYGFGSAIADGVCAQPRVAFVAVPLTEEERTRYAQTEAALVAARAALRRIPQMPLQPFGAFLAAVQHLAERDGGPNGRAANEYLRTFGARREIVASSASKYDVLGRFAPSIKAAGGTLLFTETVRASNLAITRLDPLVSIELITGGTGRGEREEILGNLRERELDAVAAPRVLDEGVDVPDANLGIVVSASRTRRQMIQRMGRILRRKPAGSGARFAILFAADTLEDPRTSFERDGFMEEIEDIAEATRVFDLYEMDELPAFLDYRGPSEIIEPVRRPVADLASIVDPADVPTIVDEPPRRAGNGASRSAPATVNAGDDDRPYLALDDLDLPTVEPKRAKKQKPRLSTGESPVTVVQVGKQWILQCTGCLEQSEPTDFRWKALDQTVACVCEG